METKEIYFKILEKLNHKDTIKEYRVHLQGYNSSDKICTTLYYTIPTPEESQDYESRSIYYEHSDRGIGFSAYSASTIECPITESEAIEVEYIFHSIKKKLKDIAYDELLELLNSVSN